MSLTSKKIAILLWILLTLFVGRVAAQLWVYLDSPDFLPPMEDWYSGLMPYRFLLPSQILIIALMIKIALDITKGEGFFGVPKFQMGVWLRNIGIIYFAGMIVRFLLQGISIMVVFHWILATFVILVGIFHLHSRKIP